MAEKSEANTRKHIKFNFGVLEAGKLKNGEGLYLNSEADIENLRNLKSSIDKDFSEMITILNSEACGGDKTAASAISIAAMVLKDNWPWIETMSAGKGNVVEVAFPPNRLNRFTKIMKDGEVVRKMKEVFEELETNMREIFGDNDYEKIDKKVLESLKDVRISTVDLWNPDRGITATNVVTQDGTYFEVAKNKIDITLRDDKTSEAIVANQVVSGRGKLTKISEGGITFVGTKIPDKVLKMMSEVSMKNVAADSEKE